MRISMFCSAMSHMTSRSVHTSPPAVARWRRSQRRTSVATWSLRERPVCSFLPASPTNSVRRRSLAVWMSSSPSTTTKVPDSHSCRTLSRPRRMTSRSSRVMIPARWMARAYAADPVRSSSHMRLSNRRLLLNFSITGSVSPRKRPPHSFAFLGGGPPLVSGCCIVCKRNATSAPQKLKPSNQLQPPSRCSCRLLAAARFSSPLLPTPGSR
mmetsp:Transcript_10438/g.31395  ORF Transcript_10438/g.31395 Transcript_10438/m.31395 type:complete len:211 (+) Transcript_10438:2164-2796(+)